MTLTPAFLQRLLQPGLAGPSADDELLAGMKRLNDGELNAVLHGDRTAKVRQARRGV